MAIGSINSMNEVTGSQAFSIKKQKSISMDAVDKELQSKISDVQQQIVRISSSKDMPVEDKVKKRQELQQQLNVLDKKLKQNESKVENREIRKAIADKAVKEEREDKDDGGRTGQVGDGSQRNGGNDDFRADNAGEGKNIGDTYKQTGSNDDNIDKKNNTDDKKPDMDMRMAVFGSSPAMVVRNRLNIASGTENDIGNMDDEPDGIEKSGAVNGKEETDEREKRARKASASNRAGMPDNDVDGNGQVIQLSMSEEDRRNKFIEDAANLSKENYNEQKMRNYSSVEFFM